MKPESKKYSATVGNQTLTFETGKLAAQAGGAVTFGTNEAIVFAAATMGGVREGIDFFPLQVEYEERLSAGGKIEMPISDGPLGSYFGMFTDKFGVEWMVDFTGDIAASNN